MKTGITTTALGAVLLLAGCGASSGPEFSHRLKPGEMLPVAEHKLDEALKEHFGSPTEMVAWDKLPVKFHAAVGTLAPGSTLQELKVNWTEQVRNLKPGQELTFRSGKLVSQTAQIKAYDAAKHLVTLQTALSESVSEGDAVIAGPGEVLKHGRLLYAVHCQHCHGVAGDGNGPTAPYLNPKPRDYRLGKFKFKTTQKETRIARDDLKRILEIGIPGTYMPSFKLLTQEESATIVEYVLWLSMRGEAELKSIGKLSDFTTEAVSERVKQNEKPEVIEKELADYVKTGGEFDQEFTNILTGIAEDWSAAQVSEIKVLPLKNRHEADAASLANGKKLYLSKDLNCVGCHGEAALGDGARTLEVGKDATGKEHPGPGLYDDWGNQLKPRNLRSGIYRGGRRPYDLYCRIHSGIKGGPMPGFGDKLAANGDDKQIWDLVNYVLSLPHEKRVPGAGPPPAPEAPKPETEKTAANP